MKSIYLIQQGTSNFYKIGFAKNSKTRRGNLQTGNLETLNIVAEYHTINYSKVETLLHRHFNPNRINGEWFELSNIDNFIPLCKLYDKNIEILKQNNLKFI